MTTTQKALSAEHIKHTLIDLLGLIAPEADFEVLDPQADLQEALDIDSFDFLNFLIALEETLDVSVPEADYGQLISLNDIVVYVAARIQSERYWWSWSKRVKVCQVSCIKCQVETPDILIT